MSAIPEAPPLPDSSSPPPSYSEAVAVEVPPTAPMAPFSFQQKEFDGDIITSESQINGIGLTDLPPTPLGHDQNHRRKRDRCEDCCCYCPSTPHSNTTCCWCWCPSSNNHHNHSGNDDGGCCDCDCCNGDCCGDCDCDCDCGDCDCDCGDCDLGGCDCNC